MILQIAKDFRDLIKEFVMLKSPAEVYWFITLVWISGAMFGRWFL